MPDPALSAALSAAWPPEAHSLAWPGWTHLRLAPAHDLRPLGAWVETAAVSSSNQRPAGLERHEELAEAPLLRRVAAQSLTVHRFKQPAAERLPAESLEGAALLMTGATPLEPVEFGYQLTVEHAGEAAHACASPRGVMVLFPRLAREGQASMCTEHLLLRALSEDLDPDCPLARGLPMADFLPALVVARRVVHELWEVPNQALRGLAPPDPHQAHTVQVRGALAPLLEALRTLGWAPLPGSTLSGLMEMIDVANNVF